METKIYKAGKPKEGSFVLQWKSESMPGPAFWYFDSEEEAQAARAEMLEHRQQQEPEPAFQVGDQVKIKQTEKVKRINKGFNFDLNQVYTVTQVEPAFTDPYRYYLNTNPAVNFPAEMLERQGG